MKNNRTISGYEMKSIVFQQSQIQTEDRTKNEMMYMKAKRREEKRKEMNSTIPLMKDGLVGVEDEGAKVDAAVGALFAEAAVGGGREDGEDG
jgi:hypothetical protein